MDSFMQNKSVYIPIFFSFQYKLVKKSFVSNTGNGVDGDGFVLNCFVCSTLAVNGLDSDGRFCHFLLHNSRQHGKT